MLQPFVCASFNAVHAGSTSCNHAHTKNHPDNHDDLNWYVAHTKLVLKAELDFTQAFVTFVWTEMQQP